MIAKSLNTVVARHEALRTTFTSDHGVPVQVVTRHSNVDLTLSDLRRLQAQEGEAEAHRAAKAFALRPFDPSSDRLLRSALFRLGDDDWILLLVAHHIAVDGA